MLFVFLFQRTSGFLPILFITTRVMMMIIIMIIMIDYFVLLRFHFSFFKLFLDTLRYQMQVHNLLF